MKRSEIRRRTPMPRPKSRIRSVNPEKKAKKRARYAAHLRSPYFRALRLERFAMDDYACVDCGGSEELQADHVSYARVPKEPVTDLRTRCKPCHMRRHALEGKRIRP